MQTGRFKFKHAANVTWYHLQNLANTMRHERVYISSKCRRCHSKWEVLSPQCKLMLQNAENILQIPRKLCCCFSVFWPSGFTSFLSSWLCKALLCPLHGFICAHLFTATKATSVRKSQTRPTSKQRAQYQLLVCSSSYTTNNNHNSNSNSNSNNKSNNNKNLLLQLQL